MAYMEGITQFLEKAKSHVNNFGKTRCPCKNCMNTVRESLDRVRRHLLTYGMSPSYRQWVYHGEGVNLSSKLNQTSRLLHDEGFSNAEFNDVPTEENKMLNILNDLQGRIIDEDLDEEDIMIESDSSRLFEDLLDEAHNQLYPGCTKYSPLNFLVR